MFSHQPLEHQCMPSHASSHMMACPICVHPMIFYRIQWKLEDSPWGREAIFHLVVTSGPSLIGHIMHLIFKTWLTIQEVIQRILSHPGLPLAGLINPSVLFEILDLWVPSHGLSKGSATQHCNQGLKVAFLRALPLCWAYCPIKEKGWVTVRKSQDLLCSLLEVKAKNYSPAMHSLITNQWFCGQALRFRCYCLQ